MHFDEIEFHEGRIKKPLHGKFLLRGKGGGEGVAKHQKTGE
jgi:hypothetical protein